MTGNELKAWRVSHKLAVTDAAFVLGVSERTLYQYLASEEAAVPRGVARLALAYSADPEGVWIIAERVDNK